MTKTRIALVVALISATGAMASPDTTARAQRLPDPLLCHVATDGSASDQVIASQVLAERGVACTEAMQAAGARLAERAQRRLDGRAMHNAAWRARGPAPRPSCTRDAQFGTRCEVNVNLARFD